MLIYCLTLADVKQPSILCDTNPAMFVMILEENLTYSVLLFPPSFP